MFIFRQFSIIAHAIIGHYWEVSSLEFTQHNLLQCLKVVNWLLKHPSFAGAEKSCEWFTENGHCYLGVVTQDVFLKLYAGDVQEEFHVAIPPHMMQQLITRMNETVDVTLEENVVIMRDSLQQVRLTQTPSQPLPVYTPMSETFAMPNVLHTIKHLHDVATEQIDATDLDLAFTTTHGFIGNYVYAKRIPYVAATPFTLPGVMVKLLLACMGEQRVEDLHVAFVRGFTETMHIQIGHHSIYTTMFSRIIPSVDELFYSVRGTHVAEVPLRELQSILSRIHSLAKDATVVFSFTENNQFSCNVTNAYQSSDFTGSYVGLGFALQIEVAIQSLYQLLKVAVDTEFLTFCIDCEQEVLHIKNGEDEMLVSLLIS